MYAIRSYYGIMNTQVQPRPRARQPTGPLAGDVEPQSVGHQGVRRRTAKIAIQGGQTVDWMGRIDAQGPDLGR